VKLDFKEVIEKI